MADDFDSDDEFSAAGETNSHSPTLNEPSYPSNEDKLSISKANASKALNPTSLAISSMPKGKDALASERVINVQKHGSHDSEKEFSDLSDADGRLINRSNIEVSGQRKVDGNALKSGQRSVDFGSTTYVNMQQNSTDHDDSDDDDGDVNGDDRYLDRHDDSNDRFETSQESYDQEEDIEEQMALDSSSHFGDRSTIEERWV